MHSNHLLLEEPIRMASILEPFKASFFPIMTKIVGTLGPDSRSVQVISACLTAGMSVARFDFSWSSPDYHQETLENLKIAVKSTKKLCSEDGFVVLAPNQGLEASSELLPINYGGLSKVDKKEIPFFLVLEVKGDDVGCVVKNSATLVGTVYTLHAAEVHIDLPTPIEKDKEIIASWRVKNKIDFLSLSHARHVEDARQFLSKLGDLNQTQIFAKIESVEMFLFQKTAIYRCNMAGKPAVLTLVVDSTTNNLRPTRAIATDVANAVLDGSDAILLGAETLRGLYPVEFVSIVGRRCAESLVEDVLR
ncbi:pyruvate kinase 2, cytosolic-like [Cucumis melo var. makuwa]|uniref:pyruvate kinase n=1 Tax=Cucumis melo var. makuwa TaxID=1194695 RepID=A0A5A7TPG1_CUCMM|nr:pyruvate kinase 2, cytosolic-like [Cucumis melo var. makuwa]